MDERTAMEIVREWRVHRAQIMQGLNSQLRDDASMIVMFAPTPTSWVVSADAQALWLLRERHLFSVTLEPAAIRSFPLLPGRLIASEEIGDGALMPAGWQRKTHWTFTDPGLPDFLVEVEGLATINQQGKMMIDPGEAFARALAKRVGWQFTDDASVGSG